jgi:hypothetical protein
MAHTKLATDRRIRRCRHTSNHSSRCSYPHCNSPAYTRRRPIARIAPPRRICPFYRSCFAAPRCRPDVPHSALRPQLAAYTHLDCSVSCTRYSCPCIPIGSTRRRRKTWRRNLCLNRTTLPALRFRSARSFRSFRPYRSSRPVPACRPYHLRPTSRLRCEYRPYLRCRYQRSRTFRPQHRRGHRYR